MTARIVDAAGARLSDAMFAVAYRMTIPVLADAKHVTVRACSARLQELSQNASDISDVVELGTAKDGKVRVVAVPVSVHVDDGAAVIQDDDSNPQVVSFEVNGIPEVQIVNLKVSPTKVAAEAKAKADQDAKDKLAAQAEADKILADKLEAARQQGREEALLAKAKAEGAASVGGKPTV